MHKATLLIQDEHRSLAAVLHGLRYVTRDIVNRGARPDFRLLEAMLAYIEGFPEVCHHPKEDAHLFRLLRERAPELAPTLDELEAQHREGGAQLTHLKSALAAFRACVDARAAAADAGVTTGNYWRDISCQANATAFQGAVEAYADFHWKHMRIEEDIVLHAAEKSFNAADWAEIETAFGANPDPLRDTRPVGDDFRALFTQIVNLAPAPIGLGPSRDAA